nr:reverse transcriptase domain-containing protein [Tanacetum cinerariifolium]
MLVAEESCPVYDTDNEEESKVIYDTYGNDVDDSPKFELLHTDQGDSLVIQRVLSLNKRRNREGNLKMSGNKDHHRQGHRFAAGGNGHDGRDPRDVEIERLRQRVRDLEIQHEIRQIRKRIRELELQRALTK